MSEGNEAPAELDDGEVYERRDPPWEDRRGAALVNAQVDRRSPDRIRAANLKAGMPKEQAEAIHAAQVADLVMRVRGIDVATWSCACGRLYMYPFDRCRDPRAKVGCGRVYQRLCVQAGCGRIVEPVAQETPGDRLFLGVEHKGGPLVDLPDDGLCALCAERDSPHRRRAKTWAASSVSPDARALAPLGYWELPEREPVLAAIAGWLDANLGRETGPCALFFFGDPGRGKTLAAAQTAYRAIVDRALVATLVWTSDPELRKWHEQSYRRDTEAARALADVASASLHRARTAPLLVIDDMFSALARGAYAERLADLVRERLNERLPTIYTSNKRPEWSVMIETDGRIDSRWQQLGQTLEVVGRDWRRV